MRCGKVTDRFFGIVILYGTKWILGYSSNEAVRGDMGLNILQSRRDRAT